MYPKIYSTLRKYYPGGKETQRYLKEFRSTQWLTGEQIRDLQLKKLQRLLKYAYQNVPYYNRQFHSLRINPEDIRSFKDFEQLPFLTRDEINNNLDDLVSQEMADRVQRNSTGGSTGVPMRFFIENAFHWWDAALEFRGREWYGAGEGDKIAWVWGAHRDLHTQGWKARLKATLQQHRYLNAFDMTETKIRDFVFEMIHWKPVMIRAYASALSLVAQYMRENNISGIHPKLIETTAEKVTDVQRELLEDTFSCKVADWYTAREMGTIGFQCPEGSMHICETRYLEVITNGQPAKNGDLGEVVLTSLSQYAMPFIRYKIGDMAVAEESPCSCGRGLPRLKEVVGRLQDFLVSADGRFVHGGYFPHTFREWPEIKRFQVYQPDQKHLEISLVSTQPLSTEWLNRLRTEIQGCFGSEMNINFHLVDEIKLTAAGKHRIIISDIKPDFLSTIDDTGAN